MSLMRHKKLVMWLLLLVVLSACSSGSREGPPEVEDVEVAAASQWQMRDIGSVGSSGGLQDDGDSVTLTSTGADIWGRNDGFTFAYQLLAGDGEIITRVDALDNTDPWAKAGLMVRQSLADDSPNAAVVITPTNGVRFQRRSRAGFSTAGLAGSDTEAPYWLKLERRGNTIRAFDSADGNNWRQMFDGSLYLEGDAYIGLVVSSHDLNRSAAATFSNIRVVGTENSDSGYEDSVEDPAPVGNQWQQRDIGNVGLTGSSNVSGSSASVQAAGEDIWFNNDGFHFVYQAITGDVELVARVVSQSSTDPWAKAGLMVRESLESNAANALIAVTPANGIRFQRRSRAGYSTASLRGSQSAAPIWLKLVRTGDRVAGYESADGSNWQRVYEGSLNIEATAYVGLAVSSHDTRAIKEVQFDNISWNGQAPAAPDPEPYPTPDPEPDPYPTPDPEPDPYPTPDPEPTPEPEPEPTPEPNPVPTPVGNDAHRTLLARYHMVKYFANGKSSPDYLGVTYRPRTFDQAPYQGWDVLDLSEIAGSFRNYNDDDWLHLTLNRDATLAVVWSGQRPGSWLRDWQEGPQVNGNRTFTRRFSAGEVVLGSIEGTINFPYTVLFAEADGTPSPQPAVPAGLPRPEINAECPNWVHDQYMTEGPDGQMYRTWHPQIDPVYWCYFGHEHGADPSLLPSGWQVPYGYVAFYNNRQDEFHNGFKGVYFTDIQGNHWYVVTHATSSMYSRFQAQFHTVYIRVESPSGEELATLGYKADFGATLSNRDISGMRNPAITPSHAGFPDQAAILEQTNGRKQVRVVDPNGANYAGYETWFLGNRMSGNALGIRGGFTLDILNPQTGCLTLTCNETYRPDSNFRNKGEKRVLVLPRFFGIEAGRAAMSGEFYTNAYATELRSGPQSNDSVRQYIKPGVVLFPFPDADGSAVTIVSQDAWRGANPIPARGPTRTHPPTPNQDLEGAIGLQN